MAVIDIAVYLAVTSGVCMQVYGEGSAQGIDRGLRCCQTGGEGVLACRQWARASAERPILRIPVSCLLSPVSRGLLNRGHVLGRHLSCNYSTRIRFWWCVMITNNYCAFHASKGPRWGPRASIQRQAEGKGIKGWGRGMLRNGQTDEEELKKANVSA